MLVFVIGSIMMISARSQSEQRTRALVCNVAGRQPALVHRYLAEVLLVSAGIPADPAGTADQLISTGNALLDGGRVLAVQGNDAEVTIPAATDATVRAKLTEEARLAHELTALGEQIGSDVPGSATFRADAAKAEALADVTANVGHDAVGRMSLLADANVNGNARRQDGLALAGIALALTFAWMLTRLIVRRLRLVGEVVTARAAGDHAARFPVTGRDEIAALSQALNHQADHLDQIQARLTSESERDGFANQLGEAFEMAEREPDAYEVVERSMAVIEPTAPMELLLADSSRAHLKRQATSPTAGAPGCGVQSPYGCVAVRRANPVVFSSSESLNTCPRLRDRPDGPASAACVPVSFMGKALGVLHVTGPDGQPLPPDKVAQMTALAGQLGTRIGTLRVLEQTQLQASTDGLTGLINRRAFENEARALVAEGRQFALAMADLDHFKVLNDTFGHEAGDRALRLFAETVRAHLRPDDLLCRYGGEEFVLLLPDASPQVAAERLEAVRRALAEATATGETPTFTVTFGLTNTTHGEATLEQMLRVADQALYAGKQAGRDRVQSSQPTADHPIPSQEHVERQLT